MPRASLVPLGVAFLGIATSFAISQIASKPDLTIERVSYSVIAPPPRKPLDGAVCPPTGKCVLTIRNIGTAAFAGAFYIAYAETESEIETDNYGHICRVNNEGRCIPVDSSLDIVVATKAFSPGSPIKFLIQTDGHDHQWGKMQWTDDQNRRDGKHRRGGTLPRIDEITYDNNSVLFIIPKVAK